MHRHRQKQKLGYSSHRTEPMTELQSPKFSLTLRRAGEKITAKPSGPLCRGQILGLVDKLGRVRSWRGQDKEPKWVEERYPPSLIDNLSMLSGSSSS